MCWALDMEVVLFGGDLYEGNRICRGTPTFGTGK